MSGIINEETIVKNIIDDLMKPGEVKLPKEQFKNVDNNDKIKILKLMFQENENEEILHYNINKVEASSNVKRILILFIKNIGNYPLKECIEIKDIISNNYYCLKEDELFTTYINQMKIKLIPFFQMVRFIAYLNSNSDISRKIIKLIKKNDNIKSFVETYTNNIQRTLWKIIVIYNHIVLDLYKEGEIEIQDSFIEIFTKSNLIGLLQRYLCYNDLCCEGEITNFIKILCNAFTFQLKSLYLTEGNDCEIINELIKIIFRKIDEQFQFKKYSNKRQMNELYESIAYNIKNCCEITDEQNYAKFVIEYCNNFNQGNKSISQIFLEGLNKKNLKNCFKEIQIENNNDNFYANIDKYMDDIKTVKKNKKINMLHEKQKNEIPNVIMNNEETPLNNEEEKDEIKNDNIENINNEMVTLNEKNNININDEDIDNKNNDNNSNINDEDIDNKNNDNNININDGVINNKNKDKNTEENIEEKKKDNKKDMALFKQLLEEEIHKVDLKYEIKIKEQNKINENIKKELEKCKESNIKMENKLLNMKNELFELKKDMKKINYRDISKIIINEYISRFKSQLPNTLNYKEEKAYYVLTLLEGKEKECMQKIVNTYYDSNIKSHISHVINKYNKKNIVGSSFDKNYVINSISNDYCQKIIDEKNDDNIKAFIDIKKIIKDLYEKFLNY